jgi:hypothetical protein
MEDNLSTDGVYDMTASLCYRVMASFGGEIPKVLFGMPAEAAIQKRHRQLMPWGVLDSRPPKGGQAFAGGINSWRLQHPLD